MPGGVASGDTGMIALAAATGNARVSRDHVGELHMTRLPEKPYKTRYCTSAGHPHNGRMDLDLIDVQFDLRSIKPRELEEAFEDPFVVRFLPDSEREDGATRFYALGRTVANRYLFFAFWTDGKNTRVVAARDMSEGEKKFYDRKYAEFR